MYMEHDVRIVVFGHGYVSNDFSCITMDSAQAGHWWINSEEYR